MICHQDGAQERFGLAHISAFDHRRLLRLRSRTAGDCGERPSAFDGCGTRAVGRHVIPSRCSRDRCRAGAFEARAFLPRSDTLIPHSTSAPLSPPAPQMVGGQTETTAPGGIKATSCARMARLFPPERLSCLLGDVLRVRAWETLRRCDTSNWRCFSPIWKTSDEIVRTCEPRICLFGCSESAFRALSRHPSASRIRGPVCDVISASTPDGGKHGLDAAHAP